MGQVLIRNIPDDVIETYKTKAQLAGTSLEQYLRNLIEAHVTMTPAERVAFADSIRKRTKPSEPMSKDEIREGLE